MNWSCGGPIGQTGTPSSTSSSPRNIRAASTLTRAPSRNAFLPVAVLRVTPGHELRQRVRTVPPPFSMLRSGLTLARNTQSEEKDWAASAPCRSALPCLAHSRASTMLIFTRCCFETAGGAEGRWRTGTYFLRCAHFAGQVFGTTSVGLCRASETCALLTLLAALAAFAGADAFLLCRG